MKHTVPMTLISILLTVSTANALPESLRVNSLVPDTFDYVFTSFMNVNTTRPTFSLNHRDGRTRFVRLQDTVQDYRITRFRPRLVKVFNKALNAHNTKKEGALILTHADGSTLTLEMGRALTMAGYRCELVSLISANTWSARAGDRIDVDGETVQIDAVFDNIATAIEDGIAYPIPLISEKEQTVLASLQQQRKHEQHMRAAAAQRLQKAREAERVQHELAVLPPGSSRIPARRPSVNVTMRRPSYFFYGTEYRYPTDFDVLHFGSPRFGRMSTPYMLVPTAFETRECGFSMTITH